MKILVVKLSSLGDIVHALPVVDVFVNNLPDASVHWLVERRFAGILRLHPSISRIIEVDTKAWRHRLHPSTLREISSAVKALRRERYDLVVDLQGNGKSGFFTLSTGGIYRFGWPAGYVREWPNLLATNRKIHLLPPAVSIREQLIGAALEVCRTLNGEGYGSSYSLQHGIPDPLIPPEACVERQKQQLKSSGVPPEALLVGLQPGTTWETKRWALEEWKNLIELLIRHFEAENRDMRIVIFWGNREEFSVARHLKEVNPRKVLLWNGGSLIDLASGIYLLNLMIGPDTGPVHIAALLGIPTVSIYRATSARRNAPASDGVVKHMALQSPLPCSPCLKKSCRQNSFCETSITSRLVFRCALELLDCNAGICAVPWAARRGRGSLRQSGFSFASETGGESAHALSPDFRER